MSKPIWEELSEIGKDWPKDGSMTDRELLERAAKAAGYAEFSECSFWAKGYRVRDDGWFPWNPLTDDGDALRLAVKLDIQVTPGEVKAGAKWWRRPEMVDPDYEVVPHDGDPYAATRRAIVRAAAAIGEN